MSCLKAAAALIVLAIAVRLEGAEQKSRPAPPPRPPRPPAVQPRPPVSQPRPPDSPRPGSKPPAKPTSKPPHGHYVPVIAYPPGWLPGGCYDPYGSYGGYPYDPYPYPAPIYSGPIVYPPVFIPAETLYGPQAVQRFMNPDPWPINPGPINPAPIDPGLRNRAALEGEEKPANRRGTGAESVALARKFVAYGDGHFKKQKYSEALARYKEAAQTAPALADAQFRLGWCYLAMGKYPLAAKAWKRGLELDPTWPESRFRLDQLYGPESTVKDRHIDALAKAVDERPEEADLFFLFGAAMHFDGQTAVARPFFERADQLLGGGAAHLKGFLSRDAAKGNEKGAKK